MNPKFKEQLSKTFNDVKDLTKQGASDVTDFVNSKMTDENKEKAKKAVNDVGETMTKAATSATSYVSSKISDEDKQKAKDTFTEVTNKAKDLGFNKENLNKAKNTAANVAGDLTKIAGKTLLNVSEKLKASTIHEPKTGDDVIDDDVEEKTEATVEERKESKTATTEETQDEQAAETENASSEETKTEDDQTEETTSNEDQGEETSKLN